MAGIIGIWTLQLYHTEGVFCSFNVNYYMGFLRFRFDFEVGKLS